MTANTAFIPMLSTLPFSGRAAVARRSVRTVLLLMLAQVAALPSAVAAERTTTTVKLDGKTVFIPEIQLTRSVIPVPSVLFLGSWNGTFKANGGDTESLCALDLKTNRITLKSPERLLVNAKTTVLNKETTSPFLDGISWGKNQTTHFAFKVVSIRPQSAVIELFTDSYAVLYNNGKQVGSVGAGKAAAAGGRGYLPITLQKGDNVIIVKQHSHGEPRLQATIYLDRSRDLQVAWQTQGGLLKKLVFASVDSANNPDANVPELDWNPKLGNLTVSLEVRDVGTNTIVLKRESARRGRLLGDAGQNFAPGIYEITYRARSDHASEFFIVGNPPDLFAQLQKKLSKYNPDAESKLDIEAQLRRARILLAKDNYNLFDRIWQEKTAWTFSALATLGRMLENGATNIAKDQPGLHIRGWTSKTDNSFQSYRLFVPSKYKPDVPLSLLVVASTGVTNATRPFIEGPMIANHQEALLWAKYAEKHGVAVLWPGYRGTPKGYTFEAVHINEAIQAFERDYNVNKQKISVYATCGAGYFAGRLVSEYPNRFAAIVYDRAVYDFPPSDLKDPSPSIVEWLEAASPVSRVLGNRNLKIFVMHDNTSPPGHGPMKLTTQFLGQAKETRDDIVTYLGKQPMTEASRIDKVFSWIAPCLNEKPDDTRSFISSKAGYAGPIMEIFTTPIIVVKGTHAPDNHKKIVQDIAESIKSDYTQYFHGAECAIKKDDDVTQEDIENSSLILIGNPTINAVWGKLQPRMPLKVSLENVVYKNKILAKTNMFEAITRHPDAPDKYILMIGTGDFQSLKSIATDNLFNAWYDCRVFTSPSIITSKLENARDARNDK